MNKNIEIKKDATYFVAIGFGNCIIVEMTDENIKQYKNDEESFSDAMYDEYKLDYQCSWDVIEGANFNQY